MKAFPFSPIRIGPLVKLTRGRPGLPKHRLSLLPDTGRLLELHAVRVLRTGRHQRMPIARYFDTPPDAQRRLPSAGFACRVVGNFPWPREDQLAQHLVGYDAFIGVSISDLVAEVSAQGRDVPMELLAVIVSDLLFAQELCRLANIFTDLVMHRPIVGVDGVTRLAPGGGGLSRNQLLARLRPERAQLMPVDPSELRLLFAGHAGATHEDLSNFLEHFAPEAFDEVAAFQEQLDLLGREGGKWARTRVHPLPIDRGYDAFIEAAWRG